MRLLICSNSFVSKSIYWLFSRGVLNVRCLSISLYSRLVTRDFVDREHIIQIYDGNQSVRRSRSSVRNVNLNKIRGVSHRHMSELIMGNLCYIYQIAFFEEYAKKSLNLLEP